MRNEVHEEKLTKVLVILAYSIAATILLFSKPANEYMYRAKNG